jgi:hypothetical protein
MTVPRPRQASLWSRLRLAFKQARNQRRLARRDAGFVRRAEAFERLLQTLPLGPSAVTDRPLVFSHAGNAGDVIFALPALRAISGDRPAILRLAINRPAFYAEGAHPLGNLRLNAATVRMLAPLLQAQPYLQRCDIDDGSEPVDVALDRFRDAPIPGDKGFLARWPFYVTGVSWELSRPWLAVPPLAGLEDTILIARSQRYRNPALDYRWLARYPRLAFVGVDVEFEEMRQWLPQLQRIEVPDFLHMASAIAGSRLFIGNQSLPYSIAEALKVPRVLEACHRAPTNVPHGPRAHDVYFQRVFEVVVERLYEGGE